MKITDLIPGEQVPYENGEEISQKILSALNPHQLPPLALWEELTVLSKDAVIAWIHSSATEKIYLLYTYYFKEASHRVFLADKESVVTFIQVHFDEEWGEGIDVMMTDTHFETVVMGNHDGVLVTRSNA